ncbi:MAG: hypothetical protein HYX28_09860 [Candidatus Koribacter versatilis]|uniref:Membrane protein 6-pyruvoyl-tetrahydropterin synthase-related domain-containing protein n=1 Tax=Candidatus Korobacter versatilis TaxID=658062 RepID=A0A932AB95_9BACT|nr:hypothetical protein [Candidatus Koribacter versatilis]
MSNVPNGRVLALGAIILLALAVHGPLLLMQLPASSYDANTHMFFASNYAQHWFNPWNEKWYGGFSQTTYPPLAHQWIALFSHVLGLPLAYMFVQLLVVLLIPVGVFRYARLWVDERAASYAAIASVFLGSLALLVYQSGQLPTTFAAALTLNALPFFYSWAREARMTALLKGVAICVAAAAVHHVTMIFGMALFAWPVLWLAASDARQEDRRYGGAAIARSVMFAVIVAVGIVIVLFPLFKAPQAATGQVPIPHGSRDNYLLNLASGMNFWIIPHGALLLALPFVFLRGASSRRLRPLFFGWFLTLLIGLGGTTPVAPVLLGTIPKALIGIDFFNVLTYERFTFWATLMTLPFVGLLAAELVRRWNRVAIAGLATAAVFTCALAVAWTYYRPINVSPFKVDQVVTFLNNEGHAKFRYLTLGFGNQFAHVSREVNAGSVDGDYNSARLLPELTASGAGQLYNAKYFGVTGMEALRSMLKHANQYGLKYIFVRDRYYEPLLAFAGWRQAEVYDNGNVTLWVKDDVPPAHKIDLGVTIPEWQGVTWGTLPMLSSLLAIFLVIALPERRRMAETVEFPAAAASAVELREAN